MRYFLTVIIIAFLCVSYGNAQINNHWQLGEVDVDFSTNPATINTVPSAANQQGYATASDENGNLLFYTDGKYVWNKNHGLIGSLPEASSSIDTFRQPTVIVPYPNNNLKYYVFSNGISNLACTGCTSRFSHYYYTIVDFTNDSLGEINYPTTTIYSSSDCLGTNYSNTLVCSNTTNGYEEAGSMTLVYNEASNFYWLIVKEIEEKKLLAFKIDSNGINPNPVISSFSSDFTIGDKYDGSIIKVSPDNNKLAFIWFKDILSSPSFNVAEFSLFDFNENTGALSNQQNIDFQYNYPLDIEFSENSDYLYTVFKNGSDNGSLSIIDLNTGIFNSRTLNLFNNSSVTPTNFSFLQRDRHNNILISSVLNIDNRNLYIHIIENQNSFSNATVRENYVYLNGNTIGMLPQLIPQAACIEDEHVSNDVLSGNSFGSIVSNNITANNTIANNATAVYNAGNSIVLQPGFHAEVGSDFHAIIEGCSGAFTLRPENPTVNNYQVNSIKNVDLSEVEVYPNPTSSLLNIQSNSEIKSWQLYDSYGIAKRKNQELNELTEKIDFSILKRGFYILKIQLENGEIISKQIIKE